MINPKFKSTTLSNLTGNKQFLLEVSYFYTKLILQFTSYYYCFKNVCFNYVNQTILTTILK